MTLDNWQRLGIILSLILCWISGYLVAKVNYKKKNDN